MPAYNARAPSQHRHRGPAAPAAPSNFTHDDVNAFRLRPLSYANTTPAAAGVAAHAPPTSTSVGSLSGLPHLHPSPGARTSRSSAASQRANAKAGTPAASQTRPAAQATSRDSIDAIRVLPAAAPRVYAALLPVATDTQDEVTAYQMASSAATPQEVARQATATPVSSPASNAAALAAGGAAEYDDHVARFGQPAPFSEPIVAPDLSISEARQLALWTRTTPAFTTTRVPMEPVRSPLNNPLHHWWRDRQSVRLHNWHVAELNERLAPALEHAVRALLTVEERHWLQERQAQTLQDQHNGVRRTAASGSPVPASKMAALMQALQVTLHQASVAFLEAQSGGDAAAEVDVTKLAARSFGVSSTRALEHTGANAADGGDEDEVAQQALSRSQRAALVGAALEAERELVKEVKAQQPSDLAAGTGLSVVMLPTDRPVPSPVLRLEAAISVTLLTAMLEQAEATTPGMDFAVQLLRRFILPHVFTDFTGWSAVRPQLGTLGEHVTHLATLSLRTQQQRSLAEAAVQAQADARYLQEVVKSWTMRAWLRRVLLQRQRLAQEAAMENVMVRLRGRVHLQRAFSAWRREAQRGQQVVRESRMGAAYVGFLTESRDSALRDAETFAGTAATMAAALFMGGSAGPTTAAAAEARAEVSNSLDQAKTGSPGILVSPGGGFASALQGSSVDSHVGWAAPPSGGTTPASSPQAPLVRQRYEAQSASRRKGVGHSRVHLSFIRQRASSSASEAPRGPPGAARGSESQLSIGLLTLASADSEIEPAQPLQPGERPRTTIDGAVERFVVRDASSDDEAESARGIGGGAGGSRGAAGGPGRGGGSDTDSSDLDGGQQQLMFLEARTNDIALEKMRSIVERGAASPLTAAGVKAPSRPDNAAAASAVRRPMLNMASAAGGVTLSGITTVAAAAASGGKGDGGGGGALNFSLFHTMLGKLREMDQVNAYLRAELAVHSRRLRKVEAANNGLRQRNRELEEGTLQLLRDKLEALNVAQQQRILINEKNRRLRHYRSRLRAHRHRPWQNTLLRVVGDVCEVSTAAAELADDARIEADRYGTGGSSGDEDEEDRGANVAAAGAGGLRQKSKVAGVAGGDGPDMTATAAWSLNGFPGLAGGSSSDRPANLVATPHTMGRRGRANAVAEVETEEERLFSRIAPIVLQSARQLPDALVILSDWANSCLDDLENLDDLREGPLSDRFHSFTEEARSGVLISRLLYYLALPRYRTTTSAAEVLPEVGPDAMFGDPAGARLDGIDRRRQLLERHGVQLNPPFPVYGDCFGDLLALPPPERMTHLLAFATELMAGQDIASQQQQQQEDAWGMNATTGTDGNDGQAASGGGAADGQGGAGVGGCGAQVDPRRSLRAAAAPPPTLSAPLPLHSVVDPYALVRGEASAVITLIALLYVRFAHPFHHKCRTSARRERNALLQLWSGGQVTQAEANSALGLASLTAPAALRGAGRELTPLALAVPVEPSRLPPSGYSIEADMLQQLPSEDKTPWQLFRERCLPVFGTQAHPFLLRGGFWPSDAFESPELAAMLSSLAMALRRSLELHRWHVTLTCLVPVRTYGGLSRGVFTGPSASAPALLVGLRQDGREELCIDHPIIRECVARRLDAYQDAIEAAHTAHDTFAVSLTSYVVYGSAAPVAGAAATTAAPPTHAPQPPLPDPAAEVAALTEAIKEVWQEDLLSLFVQRATLSAQLALPVLDLGAWRMLCSDLGLINMASPDRDGVTLQESAMAKRRESVQSHATMQAPWNGMQRVRRESVDLELLTKLFQRAVMAVSLARGEVDPAVLQPTRVAADGAAGSTTVSNDVSGAGGLLGGAGSTLSGVEVRRRSWQVSLQSPAQPEIQMDMTYASFVFALVLLANELYPGAAGAAVSAAATHNHSPADVPLGNSAAEGSGSPVTAALQEDAASGTGGGGAEDGPLGWPASTTAPDFGGATSAGVRARTASLGLFSSPAYCSLAQAFNYVMQHVVLPSSAAHLQPSDPRFILHHLTRGVRTQVVLQNCAPALLLVYQAYSKEVFGEPGMVREDVLRLLRDAMLTSTELSQYLIYELFASCAVLRQASEEGAMGSRKELDRLAHTNSMLGSVSSASSRRPGYRAVRIVDPGASTDTRASLAATQRKRVHVLTFEGFCDLLCVLCGFKQPNVFVPYEERLLSFLRRSVLRPLTHMVSGLAPLLSRTQLNGTVNSGTAPTASTNNNSMHGSTAAGASALQAGPVTASVTAPAGSSHGGSPRKRSTA